MKLIECTAEVRDRSGLRKSCDKKATFFPITEFGNVSRQHYCGVHWKQYSKFYYNVIEKPKGIVNGRMQDLLASIADNENSSAKTNIHQPNKRRGGRREGFLRRFSNWLRRL